jgi:serine/threonine protein phosphatase 1
MRIFVITDIHGKNELFRKSLKEIGLKKTDKLILLGDIIDRGEDSKGILDTIILLKEHKFDIICLMGNHEQMLLDAHLSVNNLNLWLLNGGDKTLSSFLTSSLDKIPKKYIDLIKSFKYYYEYERFIFVHAALNMKIDNPFSDIKTILWERNPLNFLDKDWLGDRKLIHGHNPIEKEKIEYSITNKESIISIDNGVYMNKHNHGNMCILELEGLKLKFVQ